jgi:flagellar biosynthesis protein FlhA
VEQILAEGTRRTDAGLQIAIDPPTQHRLADLARRQAERAVALGHHPIALCAPRIRSAFHVIAQRAVPTLVSLSYAEISTAASVESLGMLSWSDDDQTI